MAINWDTVLINYVLDERGEPVPEPDTRRWAEWMVTHESDRIVKRTKVGPWLVSTVFLGTDHAFGQPDPVLWESMVFPTYGDHVNFGSEDSRRYHTKAEALEGHEELVEKWKLKI